MSELLDPSVRERANQALQRHAWRDAYDLLADADARGLLAPLDLETFAQAAWWTGQLPVAIDARERAYAAATKAGDFAAAVIAAINLGTDNLLRHAYPVADAWLNRAERMLEGAPENPGHGWLAIGRGFQAALVGDTARSLAEGNRSMEIGKQFGDRDLTTYGMGLTGVALISSGKVEEGLRLLDEATVAAVGGELEPRTAGGICCASIEACAALGDWRRAAEWTEAQDRWCQREGIAGYPGMCRLYRSEIKMLRGAWLEAESEARRASDELQGFIPAAAGMALYQIGEIRLRRGDLPAAAEALQRAYAVGQDTEPALSLLRLAEGKIDVAQTSIQQALDEPARMPSWRAPPDSELYRVTLLPARVEIALAAGDLATARSASDELTELAERFTSSSAKASAAVARGAVLLAEGDATAARRELRDGVSLWTEVEAPYEVGRARMLLAEAEAAAGNAERAGMEAQAARAAFEELGATPDMRRADTLLARLETSGSLPPSVATRRAWKTFVFTDIVASTRLAGTLGDEAWSGVLRWHDQTVRSLVAEHAGEEIKATGDGFFLAFEDVDMALGCAVAIQRRLSDHRRQQGFAPGLRIGLHRAEANRAGLDYIGSGVNLAARIAAEAHESEVLISAASLEGTRHAFREVGRRTVTLKGIPDPVEVVSIASD
jgi:class 3 adenylate cyclase